MFENLNLVFKILSLKIAILNFRKCAPKRHFWIAKLNVIFRRIDCSSPASSVPISARKSTDANPAPNVIFSRSGVLFCLHAPIWLLASEGSAQGDPRSVEKETHRVDGPKIGKGPMGMF